MSWFKFDGGELAFAEVEQEAVLSVQVGSISSFQSAARHHYWWQYRYAYKYAISDLSIQKVASSANNIHFNKYYKSSVPS